MNDSFINSKNMKKCLLLLSEYFSHHDESDIAKVEYPNNIEYGSNEWLNYIFYSCLLDYGMRSKIYHQNLINTYYKYPEIFDSKYVVENFSVEEKTLFMIIKNNIHPRYPNVALKKWLYLSKELAKYNNMLEKMKSFSTFCEINTFIKSLKGYGQKTGGLLLRLIFDANLCNFEDNLSTIPLDRHDIEISYLNNIIDIPRLTPKQIENLANLWITTGKELNINPSSIDKYFMGDWK